MVGCGQFLDDATRNQRGLHGTAAAIRVLSCASANGPRDAVAGLVNYLRDRLAGEVTAGLDQRFAEANLSRDSVHTVKVAEVLYALSFVRAGTADTRDLVTEYAQRLVAGASRQGGWGYFLGPGEQFAALPTAHVTRALARHGYDIEPFVPRLRAAATREERDEGQQYVQIFALMVLAEVGHLRGRAEYQAVSRVWARHADQLDRPREARVNLPRPVAPHTYIGVPWQLYLMKLALLTRARAAGPASAALTRLGLIADAMNSQGLFRYSDSGSEVSTRTNGILYDVLVEAETATGASSVLASLGSLRFSVEEVVRRSRVRRVVGAVAIVAVVGVVLAWAFLGVASGVAASLVAALLLSLLGWSTRNRA